MTSNISPTISPAKSTKALILSTTAFIICFANWTIFSILGIKIKTEFGLTDTQFGILIATPILTGSLSRLFLGIWTDQYGGRVILPIVMILSAAATWLLPQATTYNLLLVAALGIGFAGGAFAVGLAYVSKWYSKQHQGTALGIFGCGNVGSAITGSLAPLLLIPYGWQVVAHVYALVMLITALLFYVLSEDDPDLVRRRKEKTKALSVVEQLAPLKDLQVWRFSLYYFFTFGAFVALVLWLPRYLMGVYGLSLQAAGMIAALAYNTPGSIFRILGGWMSDKYGARKVMYITFIGSLACSFILSYPATTYIVQGIKGDIQFSMALGLNSFIALLFGLGFFMSLGKAAVFKHVPIYYPNHVGAVGGIVGLVGGLGGFILPITFGYMSDKIGIWTSCFMLLTLIISISLTWMHFAIQQLEKKQHPELARPKFLPELYGN
jgi:NNP family nitrate/nitrite transporter-like MFS transporter